jgi:putative restriction endonuclease
MINLYVGITDYDWYRFLSARPNIEEVNFWQPGGRTNFKALRPGELFLFKLHSPRNFIVGGGVFAHSDILPVSLAWEAFGTNNGATTSAEMRSRIAYYRNHPENPHEDYSIGCRILTQPFFFPENQWIPVPSSWSPHIQQGRTYDTSDPDGLSLWRAVMEREAQQPSMGKRCRMMVPSTRRSTKRSNTPISYSTQRLMVGRIFINAARRMVSRLR